MGTYQVIVIGGAEDLHQRIDISEKSAILKKGLAKNPKATLMIDDKYLYRIHKKDLKLQEAQIQGRIKMEGTKRNQQYLLELLS